MDQHLAFLMSQSAHIEPAVYKTKYPDIQYSKLVPVDTSAAEFAGSVEYFSMDGTGKAKFISNSATDFPMVDATYAKHQVRIENAGIGYEYNYFELGYARRLGIQLSPDRAAVARRVAEELIDQVVQNGQADMGWDGLLDSPLVSKSDAPATGTGSSSHWSAKTGTQIIGDVNGLLGGVWTDSKTVELADTLAMAPDAYNLLANTPRSDGSDMTILEWIRRYNIYTAQTGRPLMIRALRGLENAAAGNGGRVIAYLRDPSVLRFHLPMPFRFMEPQKVMLRYCVPGVLRMGGLEIRRPKAIRYLDQVSA